VVLSILKCSNLVALSSQNIILSAPGSSALKIDPLRFKTSVTDASNVKPPAAPEPVIVSLPSLFLVTETPLVPAI